MEERIDRLQRASAADPAVISLGGGLPAPSLFPRGLLAAAASRVLRVQGHEALQYSWPEGREGLRAWIAARLQRRGADVSADDVIVTSGAQQALSVATQVLLRPGARVAVDPETYPGALDVFRGRGVFPQTSAEGAQVFYAMPALGNPRGRALTPEERAALWARVTRAGAGACVIEDDAYAELCFSRPAGRPLLAERRDAVWHVGTFSKTLCPGMRVGWLVPPERFRQQALEVKRLEDLQSNGLTQSVLEDFLARDDFDRRLSRARRTYARKAEAMISALRRYGPSWAFDAPDGGFSVWVELPELSGRGDEAELLECAVRQGVSFDPGRMFRAHEAPRRMALRVCFSLETPERVEEGVRRLARAWEQYARNAVRLAG